MPRAVQALMVDFVQRVDPRTKAGVLLDSSNIGTTDGDKFTEQRRLDIYNEARLILAGSIERQLPAEEAARAISGNVVRVTNLQFASGSANKPSDYIRAIYLTDVSNVQIVVIPPSLIHALRDLETSVIRFVVDEGTVLRRIVGSSQVPDASTYVLYYYGLTIYALSAVDNTTQDESFNDTWHPVLLQLMEAIANEQGHGEVLALSDRLVGQSGRANV